MSCRDAGAHSWWVTNCTLTAGSVMHRSPPNLSDKTRIIYTFHMIEGTCRYDEKNWLQTDEEFTKLF